MSGELSYEDEDYGEFSDDEGYEEFHVMRILLQC